MAFFHNSFELRFSDLEQKKDVNNIKDGNDKDKTIRVKICKSKRKTKI